MKRATIIIVLFMVVAGGCKTRKPLVSAFSEAEPAEVSEPALNFSEQSTWLLGYVNLFQMTRFPHSEWYTDGFFKYLPDEDVVNKLKEIRTDDLSILIVLGTWCPDSRREVPRFMRLVESWDFPDSSLAFIGVDNAKLAPVGDYEVLNIERVPTFIVYKNNIEIGRIIENPLTSLEQDMLNILNGNYK